jgi:hypothetical protein
MKSVHSPLTCLEELTDGVLVFDKDFPNELPPVATIVVVRPSLHPMPLFLLRHDFSVPNELTGGTSFAGLAYIP